MRQRSRRRVLIVFTTLSVSGALLASCGGGSASSQAHPKPTGATDVTSGGDIPDTQAFVSFSSPDGSFSLKVPEGWGRTATGSATVFSDKLNSVRVDVASVATPATIASATAVEVPAIKAASRAFKLGAVWSERHTAGDAVVVRYRVDSPLDPVTGKSVPLAVGRYEFVRHGRQVTITLSAPVGYDNADAWKTIVDSFGWHR